MRAFIALMVFWSSLASASSTRQTVSDSISNNSGGTSITVPATGTTFTTDTNTLTLSNKTLSGASNIFSQLPVSSQYVVDTFFANGSATSLTLSFSTPNANGLQCYRDGIALDQTMDYSYTGGSTTVTLTSAPATGQKIKCVYSKY